MSAVTPGWAEEKFPGDPGVELSCRWLDHPNPIHTLVILHGYGEHSGRYLKFADRLSGMRLRVAVLDYRGMGDADAAKEAVLFDDYLTDVSSLVTHLRIRHGVKGGIVFLGHSLGGLVAFEWARQNPAEVKRLILSAPFIGFPNLPFWRAVNAIVRFLFPAHVYKNPVIPTRLTHDPEETRLYRSDPLIKRYISAKLIGSIFDRIAAIWKAESLVMPCPVHVLAAGDERIVDSRAARKFFDRLVAPGKEFSRFEGFYHEIFNEVGQKQPFNVLKTILEDCV